MKLETDISAIDNVTAAQLREELSALGNTLEFAILSSAPSTYIQAARHANGYVIEKREGGGDETHFHAVPHHTQRPQPAPDAKPEASETKPWWRRLFSLPTVTVHEATHVFTLEHVQQVFADYLAGRESDVPLQWENGFGH